MDSFEKSFSQFLDSDEYDHAEESLFILIRAAYSAGYNAGLNKRDAGKILEVSFGDTTDEEN